MRLYPVSKVGRQDAHESGFSSALPPASLDFGAAAAPTGSSALYCMHPGFPFLGALLLTDFTVMKIMVSAIVVGMVGILSMHSMGWIKLHVKRYATNVIGGLLFGVGFALLGYCLDTGAAALGQGNYDAVAGILGLMVGSHLYSELSGPLGATVVSTGVRVDVGDRDSCSNARLDDEIDAHRMPSYPSSRGSDGASRARARPRRTVRHRGLLAGANDAPESIGHGA